MDSAAKYAKVLVDFRYFHAGVAASLLCDIARDGE